MHGNDYVRYVRPRGKGRDGREHAIRVHNIMAKLRLEETEDNHRRVLAVITFLRRSLRDSEPDDPRV